MISNKKWIGMFSVTAVLAVIAQIFDYKISKLLYIDGNAFGGLCEHIAPAISFLLCSFSFAVLMMNRSARGTRTRTKINNVIFALLSVACAFLGAYFPFRSVEEKPYIAMALFAIVASGIFIYINFAFFKQTFQKIAISKSAYLILISSGIVVAISMISFLLPQRVSYASLVFALQAYVDPNDTQGLSEAPIIAFSGASAALVVWMNDLPNTVSKLMYGGNILFVISVILTAVFSVGAVTSGNVYLSQALYGVLLGYLSVFAATKISEKRSKE